MDIMIDIETLSKRNNALICQVGIVGFDRLANEFLTTIESKCFSLHWKEQIMVGRHICPETIKWWAEQSIDTPYGNFSTLDLFGYLHKLFKDNTVEYIWFRGPDFDKVKLESLAEDFGCCIPWTYKQIRDCRTLDTFIRRERTQEEKDGAHDALRDAIAQAKDVHYVFKHVAVDGLHS